MFNFNHLAYRIFFLNKMLATEFKNKIHFFVGVELGAQK